MASVKKGQTGLSPYYHHPVCPSLWMFFREWSFVGLVPFRIA